jgi:hypothetical protein
MPAVDFYIMHSLVSICSYFFMMITAFYKTHPNAKHDDEESVEEDDADEKPIEEHAFYRRRLPHLSFSYLSSLPWM